MKSRSRAAVAVSILLAQSNSEEPRPQLCKAARQPMAAEPATQAEAAGSRQRVARGGGGGCNQRDTLRACICRLPADWRLPRARSHTLASAEPRPQLCKAATQPMAGEPATQAEAAGRPTTAEPASQPASQPASIRRLVEVAHTTATACQVLRYIYESPTSKRRLGFVDSAWVRRFAPAGRLLARSAASAVARAYRRSDCNCVAVEAIRFGLASARTTQDPEPTYQQCARHARSFSNQRCSAQRMHA